MKLNLQVEIDTNAGFCFGVKNAIEKAEKCLESGIELYCLGHIVHNQEEVNRLERLGMKSLTHSELDSIKNKTILIRSHGEPPLTYQKLEQNGNTIIEATCPVVFKLQEKIEASEINGEFVLIFGKAEHPEIVGITGRLSGDYLVIRDISELEIEKLPKQLTLYSQTTMDLDALNHMHQKLVDAGIDVTLRDTICRKVSGKKLKLEKFAGQNDVIIMVAGERSSNGRVLFEICQAVNANSYKVATLDQISVNWFQAGSKIGITGATSTPTWQMQEINDYLLDL